MGHEMSCHQSNYSITVGGPVDPQSLSFETNSTITVTFIAPAGYSILGVVCDPQSTPPTNYPLPSVASPTVVFSNPNGEAVDFSVCVRDSSPDQAVGMRGPTTTIIFKPRTTCPT
ncbi:hypothetical protein ENSA7_07390 [Enhygromyxa salina]|uniref:Uncharacterized protein n=1 Tax=Enhygromyxa salina TaxID=215803 RepID=A0A2S9YWN3_9BACT|nr:hypothetical protein ENSA7_07390 [Enhygromyxa salina]